MIVFVSCGKRREILRSGDFVDVDSTVLHWEEYIDRDSFFREVSLRGMIVNIARAKTEQEFRDSTFAETDFFGNGKPRALRSFEKGEQKGIWKSWYEDGKTKSSSIVVNGVLRDYFSYYDNGAVAVTASRLPDGTMSRTERWPNGNLKEEFTTDSLGNGTCVNYYENGKKSASGKLDRFAPDSTWMRWDSSGTPLTDTTYGLAPVN
jgi:antitoxin component YwqK of YwqJK toxin-antitoxin module